MNRHYIGLMAPPDVGRAVGSAVADALGPSADGMSPTATDALHCTLLFLGPIQDRESVMDRLAQVASRLRPIDVRLSGEARWLGRHLVLPATGLDDAGGAFREAMGELSTDPVVGERPFFGHMTVARADVDDALGAFEVPGASGLGWRASEVQLVRRGGPGEPRYVVVGSSSTRADEDARNRPGADRGPS